MILLVNIRSLSYTGNYSSDDLHGDLDVLFNIRGSDLIPVETMEWIYNGGTWVGEWAVYPILNWGIISGHLKWFPKYSL